MPYETFCESQKPSPPSRTHPKSSPGSPSTGSTSHGVRRDVASVALRLVGLVEIRLWRAWTLRALPQLGLTLPDPASVPRLRARVVLTENG